jgi:hypothetical protein
MQIVFLGIIAKLRRLCGSFILPPPVRREPESGV